MSLLVNKLWFEMIQSVYTSANISTIGWTQSDRFDSAIFPMPQRVNISNESWSKPMLSFLARAFGINEAQATLLYFQLYSPHSWPPIDTRTLSIINSNYNNYMTQLQLVINTLERFINTPYQKIGDIWEPISPQGSEFPLQHHASKDVYIHSSWATLQMLNWYRVGLYSDYEIDIRESMYCALLHDISKASYCAFTCIDYECWYDSYSKLNYEGASDNVHPDLSGEILMGKKPMIINCPTIIPKNLTLKKQREWLDKWVRENPDHHFYFNETFFRELNISQKVVALTAYMHWEFGRLNMAYNNGTLPQAVENYLDKFEKFCRKVCYKPTIQNVKKCLFVALADIYGSSTPEKVVCTNKENKFFPGLSNILCQEESLKITFPAEPAWEKFKLNESAVIIYNNVIVRAMLRGYSRYLCE